MSTIFHFTESLGGGVLTSVKNLTEVQSASNCEVSLVFLRRPDTPTMIDLQLVFTGVKIFEIGHSGPMGFLKLYSFALRILMSKKSDVIHAHSSWAGVLVRLANVFLRTSKCFYTPHSYAHLRTDVSIWKRRLFRIIEVFLNLTSKTRVISCGPTEAKIATQLFSRAVTNSSNYLKDPFPKWGIIHSQIARDVNKFKVAAVGRITPQKGPERYLRAIKFFDNYVESEWIGGGTEGNLLSRNNVKITGWLRPDDVAEKLSKLDALLITSEWEGLSMVGVEALSYGVPIISWSYYGCEDLVKHGYNGYICYSEEEFAIYISKLHRDSKLHKSMKSNARTYFLETFDQKILFQKWRNLYRADI